MTLIVGFMLPNPNDYAQILGTTSPTDALGMGIGWSIDNGFSARAQQAEDDGEGEAGARGGDAT